MDELLVAFDLSRRAKFRVTGTDRARFINGQITNDLAKAKSSTGIHAAILNARGKMDAEVFVHTRDDCVIFDADASQREELASRLERYIIADDVQVADVTDEFALLHVLSKAQSADNDVVAAERFGPPGLDIWAASAERDQVVEKISRHYDLLDDERAETFRIERGVPRWGFELTPEIIPIEANLASSAVDYMKGCYIGQEVISRMKMSGQTNKRLCGLVSLSDVALTRGARLFETEESAREIGWITSATFSAKIGKQIALGFVRRGYNDPDRHIFAGDQERIAAEVTQLPFV